MTSHRPQQTTDRQSGSRLVASHQRCTVKYVAAFKGYSAYYSQLTKAASDRYKKKIYVMTSIDPYSLEKPDFGDNIDN